MNPEIKITRTNLGASQSSGIIFGSGVGSGGISDAQK
jgi:hypothetical protein